MVVTAWILFGVFLVLALILGAKTTIEEDAQGKIKRLRWIPGLATFLAYFLVLALPCYLFAMSFTEVDSGQVAVVKHFGQPVGLLYPGAHFVRPYGTDVVPIITQTRIVKVSEDTASHDLQIVHTEVTVQYHADASSAIYILTQLNDDAEARAINPATLEAIKATTAQYDVQDLVGKRPVVRDKIEAFIKERLLSNKIVAEGVFITDFSFSKEFESAIEAKVTAQQLAEKATNDLKRIQIEADQKVAQAKGEAEALRVQKEQITPELIRLRTVEMMQSKWDGHLPNVLSGGGALPMMDVLAAAHQGKP